MAEGVTKGKIIRFDEFRGYGFIAPDHGGDDIFMHLNDLEFDKRLAGRGVAVEFVVSEGERGLKASNVRLDGATVARPERLPVRPVARAGSDDDELCDVLSLKEFLEEVTEGLLEVAPTITAEAIVQIRQRMGRIAHGHGWVDS